MNNNTQTIKRAAKYLKARIPLMGLSMILSLIAVASSLYVPVLVGRAIDCIGSPTDWNKMASLLITVVICVLVTAVIRWVNSLICNRVTYDTVKDIRSEAFIHLQNVPVGYIDENATGSTVSKLISDADAFADGLLMGFSQLFTGIATILGTLIFMLSMSLPITAIVVLLTPLSLLVARFIAKKTHDLFVVQSQDRAAQTALIDEAIGEQKVIRSLDCVESTFEKFSEINDQLAGHSLYATFFSSLTNPSTRFVNAVVYAAVALAGALAVISGGLTVGGLCSFLSYCNQYTGPFNEISGVITELQNALVCAGRVFDLIDSPSQEPDPDSDGGSFIGNGEVSMEHVSFSYNKNVQLIRDMNMHVMPGQRVAIVGPTGCGKTTLINLLMRFYDPDSGAIRIDGKNTREKSRKDLRSGIGMVLQDTWLASGTIRENIAMGKPDASDGEIIAAAEASHAHSFITRLPDGYDTVISESGNELSQGQKQLLCITRLMLCIPPLLILDEATSSIDTRTEQKIQRSFAKLMAGRTSFIVAHRLSTIRSADTILVMKDSKIIETGKHDELIRAGGFYARLYASQFEE